MAEETKIVLMDRSELNIDLISRLFPSGTNDARWSKKLYFQYITWFSFFFT